MNVSKQTLAAYGRRADLLKLLQTSPDGWASKDLCQHYGIKSSALEVDLTLHRNAGLIGWAQTGRERYWTGVEHLPALRSRFLAISRDKEQARSKRERKVAAARREKKGKEGRDWSKPAWREPEPLYVSIWHYAERMAA